MERAKDLSSAIERALTNRPALLDVEMTTEAHSSDAKTGFARAPDLQLLATWDEAERQWREKQSLGDLTIFLAHTANARRYSQ